MVEIQTLFEDRVIISKIKRKLAQLFQIAEVESSRAGKIGMEVGSVREKIIISLLIHYFGRENIDADLPITEPEADVLLNGQKMSIKTITGNGGVKAVWTVDAQSARNFINNYTPWCDIIFAQIFWGNNKGGLYLIPLNAQRAVFRDFGKERYLKMPKAGTNPRGVEFSGEAVKSLLSHQETKHIQIDWKKTENHINIYQRWVDYWASN